MTTIKDLAKTLPHIGLRRARIIERSYSLLAPDDAAARLIRKHISDLLEVGGLLRDLNHAHRMASEA